jgi:hypothetical protein
MPIAIQRESHPAMISNNNARPAFSPFPLRSSRPCGSTPRSLCNHLGVRYRSLLCLILLIQLISISVVPASAAWNAEERAAAPATAPAATESLNLDLSSTNKSVSANLLGISESVNISAGGVARSISPTDLLTAAEFVAASQVLSGGMQTLKVATDGSALRGRFSLSPSTAAQLTGLVIPQHVKLFQDFGTLASLSMSGDLVNSGKIFAFSTNPAQSLATLNAQNIVNQSSGLITSVLSSECGAANALSNLSLSLNSTEDIINNGTIISAGGLALSAGNSISNIGASAIMQATNSVNLYAAAGQFQNSGTINAVAENINVSALTTSNIVFNSVGGQLRADNGAINYREQTYASSANLDLHGGNYLSQALNLNSGSGITSVDVGEVEGVVNTIAGCAHISADTPNLRMGTFEVSGDPWINSTGSLDLGGVISTPLSYLVATAGGSIYTSLPSQCIDTSFAGGNVVLIAGVAATEASGTVSLTNSLGGGDIVLVSGKTIDGTSTQDIAGILTGGGNLTLIAVSDGATNNSTGGHILIHKNASINTSGGNSAGSIMIAAEAGGGSADAISIGNIIAGGIDGTVVIKSANANLSGAVINSATGAIAGDFNSDTLNNGNFSIQSVKGDASLIIETSGKIALSGSYEAQQINVRVTTLDLADGTLVSAAGGDLFISGAIDDLTIVGADHGTASLIATDGKLTIQSMHSGDILLTSETFNGATSFILDSDQSIHLQSQSMITVDQTVVLANSASSGGWNIIAPTIQFSDGSLVDATVGNANLDVHANIIFLGTNTTSAEHSHNPMPVSVLARKVTMDDSLPGTKGFLKILCTSDDVAYHLISTDDNLTISANSKADSFLVLGDSTIYLDSPTNVGLSASKRIYLNQSTTIRNGESGGDWILSAKIISTERSSTKLILSNGSKVTFHLEGDSNIYSQFINNGEITAYAIRVESPQSLKVSGGDWVHSSRFRPTGPGESLVIESTYSLTFENTYFEVVEEGHGISLTAPHMHSGGKFTTAGGEIILRANASGNGSLEVVTFKFFGGPVSTFSDNVYICDTCQLSTDKLVQFNINNGKFSNFGSVLATNIIITSPDTLTVAGKGAFSSTSGNPLKIESGSSLFLNDGTSFSITGGGLSLQAPLITVGANANSNRGSAYFHTNGQDITMRANSAANGSVELHSDEGLLGATLWLNGGPVTVSGTTLSMSGGLVICGNNEMTLKSLGDLTLASVLSYQGSINIINHSSATGNIVILADSAIASALGNILIRNENTIDGNIILGGNAFISAGSYDASQGNIEISIGSPAPTSIKMSSNIKSYITNGGKIFFGSRGITAAAPLNNLYANGRVITFNTGELPASAISLEGGVIINGTRAPLLTSLDFTDSFTGALVKEQQVNRIIGGFISQNNTGWVGNVTLTPLNLMPLINGEVIPVGLTLTMNGFTATRPLRIETSLASSSTKVEISGTQKFTGNAVIDAKASSFVLRETGMLTSDNAITLNVSGVVILMGKLLSKTSLSLNVYTSSTSFSTNPAIKLDGATIGSTSSTVLLNIVGTGHMEDNYSTSLIRGKSVTLSTDLGDIGSDGNFIDTKSSSVTILTNQNGTGNAYVRNSGTVTINSLVGGELYFGNDGQLAINDVSAGMDVLIVALGSLTVSKHASSVTRSVALATTNGRSIKIMPEAEIIANDGNIYITCLSRAGGAISIGQNVNISATGTDEDKGNILIALDIPENPKNTTAPANITEHLSNGGVVYYGTNGILAKKPPVTINANARTIILNTGLLKESAITIQSGATITATQPVSFTISGEEFATDTGDYVDDSLYPDDI